ncbi:MAG: glycosyltransferase [Desulfonauticus sp.]|nr:glycosyltransferase [Desulfonauticus sp.]
MNRIGILINSLEGGGAQTQALHLMKGLIDADIDVYLILLDKNKDILPSENIEKVLILTEIDTKANTLKKTVTFPLQWKNLKKIIKELNISIIISFMERANILNLLSFDSHKKILRSSTNIASALPFKPPLKRYLIKLFYPLLLNKANTIVFNSKGVAQKFSEVFYVDKKKVKIIYNICDIDKIKKDAKEPLPEKFSYLFKKKTIITVGRLVHAKGHWHLLRIFKKLCEKEKDLQLIIIGDGPLKDYLNTLSLQLCIQDKVFFAGFQKNPISWISRADLFVLTSIWEGFPNVLLEAMAIGIPVISTDCFSGPREILDPNSEFSKKTKKLELAPFGILTPALDGKKYAYNEPLTYEEKIFMDGIERLLTDKNLRESYAKRSVKRAEDFSFKKIIPKWIDLIKCAE